MSNFEHRYLLKKLGGILREFGEILGKYRILDVESLGSKEVILHIQWPNGQLRSFNR